MKTLNKRASPTATCGLLCRSGRSSARAAVNVRLRQQNLASRSASRMSPKSHQRQIQPADPAVRRRALTWLAVLTFLGLVALLVTERWLAGVTRLADTQAAMDSVARALWFTAILGAAGALAFGVYAWRLAARVQAALRFPPSGLPVVRDTVILVGQAAVRRAYILRVIGVLLVVAGASLVVAVSFILHRLVQSVV